MVVASGGQSTIRVWQSNIALDNYPYEYAKCAPMLRVSFKYRFAIPTLAICVILCGGYSSRSCFGQEVPGAPAAVAPAHVALPVGAVVAAIQVSSEGSATTLPLGTTLTLHANGTTVAGAAIAIPSPAWVSSDTSVAEVSDSGVVTGKKIGGTNIAVSTLGAGGVVVSSNSFTVTVVPQDLKIDVSPSAIVPTNGKLPTSITIAVSPKNCDPSIDLSLSGYSLAVTGVGLTLSSPTFGKCVATASLALDASAAPGNDLVILRYSGTNVAVAPFAILDAAAGPIPPGLAPEVDVLWEVMSQDNCSDVFGKRVAHSLYCIQLKIGNNTGHPVQIAGVGFKHQLNGKAGLNSPEVTLANSSYASTRSVLLESQTWSTRNIIANSMQGAGLVMAGFAPLVTAGTKTNLLTAQSIVSIAALQAFNLVFPDPIIAQLKSLDDQSFRDSMIVPITRRFRPSSSLRNSR